MGMIEFQLWKDPVSLSAVQMWGEQRCRYVHLLLFMAVYPQGLIKCRRPIIPDLLPYPHGVFPEREPFREMAV